MSTAAQSSERAPRLTDQARKRLNAELRKLKQDGSFSGANEITFEPVEEKLQEWSVVVKGWSHPDASSNSRSFAKELQKTGLDGVEFRVCFPEDYPVSPPFVYLRKPFVTFDNLFDASGSMCLDVLMPAGWTPATTVGSLMTTIRSHMDSSIKLSPGWKHTDGSVRYYTEKVARDGFGAIVSIHSNWSRVVPHEPAAKRARLEGRLEGRLR
jgi:ubiquitin-conjugating enzyme E2 Q